MIFIGADHRGYKLKEKIASWLFDNEYKFFDMGAQTLDKTDNYTKYAAEVASMVADHKLALGILVCGSGVGVDVVANKFDGVRASIGINKAQIKSGRNDDNMNVLVLAGDYVEEEEALEMVETFLETKFSAEKRHIQRLEDIGKIEANN